LKPAAGTKIQRPTSPAKEETERRRRRSLQNQQALSSKPQLTWPQTRENQTKLFLGSLALEEFTDCCLPLSWVLGCQRKRGSRAHLVGGLVGGCWAGRGKI